MKAKRPHFAPRCALVLAVLCLSGCQSNRRAVLKIGISPITHVAAGQSVRLSAYQEYRAPANEPDAVQAASARETLREPITAQWSISDASLASLSGDGTLTALRPGKVTAKSNWEGYEAIRTITIVRNLAAGPLPRMSAQGTECQPQDVSLDLTADRTLRFQLSFADSRCADVTIRARAPDQQLPWKIDSDRATLQLKSASGLIVSGDISIKNGGQVLFTAWSGGEGAYPVSLAGKTVLLIGDSMAEGIGWFLRGKVEAANATYVGEPWCSSTTCSWQGTGRLREMLERHKPDIVFIALGSNEIFIKQPEARAPIIRQMVQEIGDRPAYWIGPPSWKPDKGIVRVIEENFQPGHFYNSNDLVVPRRKDGAHPTYEGYQTWTELIWNWYARVG
jgi:lysophospholipase L1-like esterase